MRKVYLPLLLYLAIFMAYGCGGSTQQATEDELHNHDEENPDEIVFPASQAERTDFKVETVTVKPFAEVIKCGGRIMPAQGDQVTLIATADGVVSYVNKRLAEGSSVGRGQHMFYLSSKNIASGDLLAKKRAAYNKAKSDFERAESLIGDKLISQREYNEINEAWIQAKTEYEALSAAGSGRGVAVSTSIGGYVTSLNVQEGDYVEMGQVLGSVSQNRNLVLRAELSQQYLQRLKTLQSANFTIPYSDTTFKLSELGGRLTSIGSSVTEGSTLLPVTFEFANNGKIIPGTFVEVYLLGTTEEDAITLPLTAVTEQQGLYYVYIQLDEEHYQRQEVKLGGDNGLDIEILSGISEGDRVVTRGAVNVKMAASSGEIPHGHQH